MQTMSTKDSVKNVWHETEDKNMFYYMSRALKCQGLPPVSPMNVCDFFCFHVIPWLQVGGELFFFFLKGKGN